jgi:hypothetical protein
MANRSVSLFAVLFTGILFQSCGGGGGGGSTSTNTTPTDTTPPVVLSTNPSNNATGVATNASLIANFSENINPANPASAFTLTQGGTTTTGTVVFSGSTATFTPSAKLANNLPYTATLTTGIKDLAGNPLASPFTWNFSTSDCNAITLLKQFSLNIPAISTGFKAMATDGTSIYLWTMSDFTSAYGTVYKIDPTNGSILGTTVIPIVPMAPASPVNGIQFIADIAWHNGALWATGTYIAPGGAYPQAVFRINLITGLAENQLPISAGLPGESSILQGLASDGTNLFVAMDRYYSSPASQGHTVVKFDPATSSQIPLSPTLLTTTGQAIRLDYGGGALWVFNNPNFEKVDPALGTVLSNYCKTDGGANILYFNGTIWTIKDTTLMVYSL